MMSTREGALSTCYLFQLGQSQVPLVKNVLIRSYYLMNEEDVECWPHLPMVSMSLCFFGTWCFHACFWVDVFQGENLCHSHSKHRNPDVVYVQVLFPWSRNVSLEGGPKISFFPQEERDHLVCHGSPVFVIYLWSVYLMTSLFFLNYFAW
jgi:hypothetical protein